MRPSDNSKAATTISEILLIVEISNVSILDSFSRSSTMAAGRTAGETCVHILKSIFSFEMPNWHLNSLVG
jgi:hypothetical protein